MKRIALVLFVAVIGFGMMSQEAEARRFGGGRSSGISRDSSVMQRSALPAKPAAPSQATTPAPAPAPAAPARPGMGRWLGPLAGLAAGIGLASLFSHMGMGGGMGDMLALIALAMAALFLVRWFMSRRQAGTGMQYAGAENAVDSRFEVIRQIPASAPIAIGNSAADVQAPADFDVEGFLRQAKLNFVRLQAANDRGDMDDIRQFTSPEMFAEVQLDYQDRSRNTQQTDVIELKADLLDVTAEATRHIASVRFHGLLREQKDAAPETFSEVWHLSKPNDEGRNWIVVGIQQG